MRVKNPLYDGKPSIFILKKPSLFYRRLSIKPSIWPENPLYENTLHASKNRKKTLYMRDPLHVRLVPKTLYIVVVPAIC